MENWLSRGTDVDGALANPVATWMFDSPAYVIWAILAVVFLAQARKQGQLSLNALIFFGATSMFWQEFYADWGAKLVYSPDFALMPWESPMTSPNKPWFMPAAYGCYFVTIYALQNKLIMRLRGSGRCGLLWSVLLVTVPLFYLWDLLVEGIAVMMGWWVYLDPIGPSFHSAYGAMPLMVPILIFVVYGVAMAYLIADVRDNGRPRFESIGGFATGPAGAGREVRRVIVWCVVMNVVYGAFLAAPCMAVRILSGS